MRIRKITVTSYPPDTEKSYKKSETWFDINGNKIEYREYKSGKAVVWEKFVYDHLNRVIEQINFSGKSYNSADYKGATKKITYDQHGYLITGENQTLDIVEDELKIVSSYYLNGTIKNKRYYTSNICIKDDTYGKGNLTRSKLYNESGLLLEVRNFRSDGIPLKCTINTYNKNGRLIRIKSVSKRRTQLSDEEGQRIGDEYISEDRILKYDDAGLLIEDIDSPVEPDSAFADIKDSSNGYNHKYFYNINKQLEIDNVYLCGELVMGYRYNYHYWEE